jgi:endonuclease YncB( thermonuclease family)
LAAGRTMECRQTDTDRYGRVVAVCAVEGVNLSCEQLRSGHAIRRYASLTC